MRIRMIVLTVLLAFAADPVFSTPAAPVIPTGSVACTSFSLDNHGAPVFGTNFDNTFYKGLLFVNKRNVAKSGWEPGTTGDYATWVSRYGSVTFNLAGYQLVWAGMNEAGLMLSTMALGDTENPAPDERPPLNSPLWLQYLLDNFSTVEEVIASDSTVRITGSVDHFLVCDIAGECAAIEFLDGEMVVHTGDAMPVHALTNTPYAIALETWQSRTRQQIIDSGNGSRLRFAIAADRGTGFDPDGEMTAVDYAFETLEQVSDAHAPTSPTQWSIVFDPANLEIHFRTRDNPAIRHLALGGLDFSCKTPVLMHTIHATEPSGDISGELVPYDHDVSLDHMLDFLQQWDPSIPPVTIKVLLSQIEQAPCME